MRYWAMLAALAAIILAPTHSVERTTDAPKPKPAPVADGSKYNPYMVNFVLVPKVDCGGNYGTGEWISGDTLLTAHHVIDGQTCTVNGKPMTVLYSDADLDFSVARVSSGHEQRLAYTCEGFKTGETYYAVGWTRGSRDFAMTTLVADERYFNTVDTKTKQKFTRVRGLKGRIHKGMSGGPIFNAEGEIVGMNNASDIDGPLSYSRELKDTYLCAAPDEIVVTATKPKRDARRPVHAQSANRT